MTVTKNLIDNVNKIKTTLNEISVYNLDVKTSLELYYELAKKVNEVITELSRFEGVVSDEVVEQNKKLLYLLGEGLKEQVGVKIDELITNGTMDSIINHKIFNDLNTKIETYKQQTDEQFNTIMNRNKVNIKDYGAVGDWSSHPARNFYDTLESLKKVYPLATSLDDEIDSLALEKAVNENYKEIYIPYGGYKINKTITLKDNQKIYGASKSLTQLDCDSNLNNVIIMNGHNIEITDIKFTTTFNNGAIGSPNTKTTCIKNNGKNHLRLSDLFIVGFNVGIDFDVNAYVIYNNRLRIQSCNTGLKGHGEFNNVSILQSTITHCDICLDLGSGSNILVQGCDIERSNRGIIKKHSGDVSIKDNYFELNEVSSIEINWSSLQTDFVLIDGNSFFATGSTQINTIKYHTSPDKKIIITNNNFRSYGVTSGVKIKCLVPTNNTQVKPIFVNNLLTSDYEIGVSPTNINYESYYDNGLRLSFTSDLTNGLSTEKPSIRGIFSNQGVVTLPSLKNLNKVFKLLFVKTGTNVDGEYMTLDSTNHDIVGENKLVANQIYSVYYNRVVNGKEEVILAKG